MAKDLVKVIKEVFYLIPTQALFSRPLTSIQCCVFTLNGYLSAQKRRYSVGIFARKTCMALQNLAKNSLPSGG